MRHQARIAGGTAVRRQIESTGGEWLCHETRKSDDRRRLIAPVPAGGSSSPGIWLPPGCRSNRSIIEPASRCGAIHLNGLLPTSRLVSADSVWDRATRTSGSPRFRVKLTGNTLLSFDVPGRSEWIVGNGYQRRSARCSERIAPQALGRDGRVWVRITSRGLRLAWLDRHQR
jgi:hypothetical protein